MWGVALGKGETVAGAEPVGEGRGVRAARGVALAVAAGGLVALAALAGPRATGRTRMGAGEQAAAMRIEARHTIGRLERMAGSVAGLSGAGYRWVKQSAGRQLRRPAALSHPSGSV